MGIPREQFELLANHMPVLCWMADASGYLYWYNRRWYEYTGTTAAEMEGWGWRSVHDPSTLDAVTERWTASLATGEPFDMVFPLRGADGVYRPFLTRVEPYRDEAGSVAGWFGNNVELTAQQEAEEALRRANEALQITVAERTAALEQRDLLLREVYHRVKNNLQIVDSLILLQSRRLSDPDSRAALEGLRRRIFALGLVHQQLMGSADLSTFDIAPFLHELAANLAEANATQGIDITVRAAPIDVGLDVAVPLGLLVTELVTNAVKHAFPDGKGTIEITLDQRPDGGVDLVVRDDGQGFELEAVRKRRGLGADIVRGLVAQLNAKMQFTSNDGSHFEVRLERPGT